MLDLGRVKLALRLDARPLDGEAVGVQARIGQQFNVLLISLVMVAGNAVFACLWGSCPRPVVERYLLPRPDGRQWPR